MRKLDKKNLPCDKGGDCIGGRCPHFVDLGLEGTDCDLQFAHEEMEVIPGNFAGLETVFL